MTPIVIRRKLVPTARRHIGHVVELHGWFQDYYDAFLVSDVDLDQKPRARGIQLVDRNFVAAYEVGVDPKVGGRTYLGRVELTGTIFHATSWPSGVGIAKVTRAIIHVYGKTHDLTPLLDPVERHRAIEEYHRKYSVNR